ncbi:MAG: hypothetical protein Solivirus5_12 [Solivirus sp.]|uniref:Uncharacterized protein n=1 Tax=Solivirus sp. TaxID=2487772 RepID=A0A3G5AHM2_9VIRU|nr:MAG: hypothetical protein Solivirus5_12 [Solivirus sp.]
MDEGRDIEDGRGTRDEGRGTRDDGRWTKYKSNLYSEYKFKRITYTRESKE